MLQTKVMNWCHFFLRTVRTTQVAPIAMNVFLVSMVIPLEGPLKIVSPVPVHSTSHQISKYQVDLTSELHFHVYGCTFDIRKIRL